VSSENHLWEVILSYRNSSALEGHRNEDTETMLIMAPDIEKANEVALGEYADCTHVYGWQGTTPKQIREDPLVISVKLISWHVLRAA
jgi:hypothetical protein